MIKLLIAIGSRALYLQLGFICTSQARDLVVKNAQVLH